MKKLVHIYLLFLFVPITNLYAKGYVVIKNYGSDQEESYGRSEIPSEQNTPFHARAVKKDFHTPIIYDVGVTKEKSQEALSPTVNKDSHVIIERNYPYGDEY